VWDHGPGAHHRLIQSGHRTIDVTHAFFTHLHYDHCMDYGRLVLQRWDQGADRIPDLQVYGPPPLARMTNNCSGPTASTVLISVRVWNTGAAWTSSRRVEANHRASVRRHG
jgi:ribonuclease BN (tRNA processing enzyme)